MSAPKPAIPAAETAAGIIFVRKIFKIRNSFWKEFEYQRSKLIKQKHEENITFQRVDSLFSAASFRNLCASIVNPLMRR